MSSVGNRGVPEIAQRFSGFVLLEPLFNADLFTLLLVFFWETLFMLDRVQNHWICHQKLCWKAIPRGTCAQKHLTNSMSDSFHCGPVHFLTIVFCWETLFAPAPLKKHQRPWARMMCYSKLNVLSHVFFNHTKYYTKYDLIIPWNIPLYLALFNVLWYILYNVL